MQQIACKASGNEIWNKRRKKRYKPKENAKPVWDMSCLLAIIMPTELKMFILQAPTSDTEDDDFLSSIDFGFFFFFKSRSKNLFFLGDLSLFKDTAPKFMRNEAGKPKIKNEKDEMRIKTGEKWELNQCCGSSYNVFKCSKYFESFYLRNCCCKHQKSTLNGRKALPFLYSLSLFLLHFNWILLHFGATSTLINLTIPPQIPMKVFRVSRNKIISFIFLSKGGVKNETSCFAFQPLHFCVSHLYQNFGFFFSICKLHSFV